MRAAQRVLFSRTATPAEKTQAREQLRELEPPAREIARRLYPAGSKVPVMPAGREMQLEHLAFDLAGMLDAQAAWLAAKAATKWDRQRESMVHERRVDALLDQLFPPPGAQGRLAFEGV